MEDNQNNEIIKEILDRQIEIEKLRQKKTPIWKIVAMSFIGFVAVVFLGFACYMMYMQSFTIEMLLTVLLSFFSIGLSIMFYIQSEKSSSAYYMRSYDIMKEVSVILGKIEVGFNEKLSHINSSIEKIEKNKLETENKIEQGQKYANEIKEKIVKETLSEEEKTQLLSELEKKQEEIVTLRHKLDSINERRIKALKENSIIREKMINQENLIQELINENKLRNYLYNYKKNNENNKN